MIRDTGLRCGRRELWTDDDLPPGQFRAAVQIGEKMQAAEITYVNPADFERMAEKEAHRMVCYPESRLKRAQIYIKDGGGDDGE